MRTDPPANSLLGAPVVADLTAIDADVAILGIPFGWPYPRPGATAGCAAAPAAIRARSARLGRFRGHWDFDLDGPMLPDDGARIVDAGDVPGAPDDGPGNAARTTEAVRAILDAGAVPICLGGDDSVPIPILRAFADRGPITVLQVDAHLDFRHEVHGVREGYSSPMRRAAEMPHVARIVQVGLRGAGSARPADVEDARRVGNLLLTARDVHERGINGALEALPVDGSVFLSLDLDGLDPAICPGVAAPAPGGLTYGQALALVRGIGPRLAGAVITEYVPALDIGERTALVATRLAVAAASLV